MDIFRRWIASELPCSSFLFLSLIIFCLLHLLLWLVAPLPPFEHFNCTVYMIVTLCFTTDNTSDGLCYSEHYFPYKHNTFFLYPYDLLALFYTPEAQFGILYKINLHTIIHIYLSPISAAPVICTVRTKSFRTLHPLYWVYCKNCNSNVLYMIHLVLVPC